MLPSERCCTEYHSLCGRVPVQYAMPKITLDDYGRSAHDARQPATLQQTIQHDFLSLEIEG